YNATFPTFSLLGEKGVPKMAKERGIDIVQSLPVQMTTQDFAGQSQQIAKKNPDAPYRPPAPPVSSPPSTASTEMISVNAIVAMPMYRPVSRCTSRPSAKTTMPEITAPSATDGHVVQPRCTIAMAAV